MDYIIDSKFYHFLNKISDLMILSILWFVTALPIVTLGSASSALYYCVNKVIRQEQGSLIKSYFQAFRENFKQSLLLTGLLVLLSLFITLVGTSVYTVLKQQNVLTGIYAAYLIMLGLGIGWMHYAIAYIARFRAPIAAVLKNSLVICLSNLPATLSLVVMFLIVWGLWAIYLPRSAMILLILPGTYAWLSSFLLERIYGKYLHKTSM